MPTETTQVLSAAASQSVRPATQPVAPRDNLTDGNQQRQTVQALQRTSESTAITARKDDSQRGPAIKKRVDAGNAESEQNKSEAKESQPDQVERKPSRAVA